MKIALAFSLVASAAAFSQESSRREAIKAGAAVGAAFLPAAAQAAAGDSPKFSVFGLVGDKTAFSEGAAYGTDQSVGPTYSPYSVYSEAGPDSVYQKDDSFYSDKKKAVLSESRKRLQNLPSYIEKQKWFEVSDELTRYMYETRGAAKFLAKTPAQKKAATAFFKAIEKADISARRRDGAGALAAASDSIDKLDDFTASL